MVAFSINDAGPTGYLLAKEKKERKNWDPYLISFIKINCRWITDSSVLMNV